MITSYKNTGKINSESTGNNYFCNIWKDVNFTEVTIIFNLWTLIHAYSFFGNSGMTWVSK